MKRWTLFVCLAVAVMSAAPMARALEPLPDAQTERMRRHFSNGVKLYDAKPPDYEGALAEFRAAYAEKSLPAIKQNVALCLKALHKYPEAIDSLEEMLAEGGDTLKPGVREAASREITEMSALIATVRVTVDSHTAPGVAPPRVVLVVDEAIVPPAKAALPLRLGPGEHAFRAHADGFADAQTRVTVVAGQRDVPVVLELVPVLTVARESHETSTPTAPLPVPPPPPPIDPAPPPPPPEKKTYGMLGLSLQQQNMRLAPQLDEPPDGTKRTFTGAALVLRGGRKIGKYADVGGIFELGLFKVEDYASPHLRAPQVPAKMDLYNWVLAPELRLHTRGQLRFLTSFAVGLEGQILSATLAEPGTGGGTPTATTSEHKVNGAGIMAMFEAGVQVELKKAFVEGTAFFDVHAVEGLKENGNRLFYDSPAARVGLRLLVGFHF